MTATARLPNGGAQAGSTTRSHGGRSSGDSTPPQVGTVGAAVIALSPWTVPGRVPRCPDTVRTGGRSSRIASNIAVSLRLAAVTTTVSGSPPSSPTSWSLLPGLSRSSGFARQPFAGSQARGRRGAGHIHHRGETGPVGNRTMPAAVGWPRGRRQQGRHDRPQLVRHQVVRERRLAWDHPDRPKGANDVLLSSHSWSDALCAAKPQVMVLRSCHPDLENSIKDLGG